VSVLNARGLCWGRNYPSTQSHIEGGRSCKSLTQSSIGSRRYRPWRLCEKRANSINSQLWSSFGYRLNLAVAGRDAIGIVLQQGGSWFAVDRTPHRHRGSGRDRFKLCFSLAVVRISQLSLAVLLRPHSDRTTSFFTALRTFPELARSGASGR